MAVNKPTVEEIIQIRDKCKTHYAKLWELYKEDERFYELDFKADLKIPNEFENDTVVLPTARDKVDSVVDHSDISDVRVYVNKKNASDTAKESAELLRKLALGIIHRTNVESTIAPQRTSAKHYWVHGLSVVKTTWDVDNWIDRPVQKNNETENDYAARIDEWRSESRGQFPISIQAINPACILPDPYTYGQLYVFETSKRMVYDAKRLPFRWKNPQNKAENDTVEYTEYWDRNYRCVLIDDEPVWKIGGGVIKHKYDFIPYTLIESGLGNITQDGSPEKRFVGLLRYIKPILIAESAIYTMCNILVKRETMKGGYITGGDAGTLGQIKQEYGKYWAVGQKDVEFHDWESKMPPAEAYAHLGLTNDYIAMHTATRTMMGVGESGVRSGADRRLVLTEGQSKLNYSKDAFGSGWANVLTKCARLVKNVIPGDFEIWTRTPSDEFDMVIKKSLMKEPFNYYIEFSPISEEDEYRRHEDLMRMVNAGLVSKWWAWKKMSDVDPKDMERQQLKESIRNSEAFQGMIMQFILPQVQQALQELGLPANMIEQPPENMPPQMQGRPLTTDIPNRAQPGSQQEMLNQMMTQFGRPGAGTGQGAGGGGNTSFGV